MNIHKASVLVLGTQLALNKCYFLFRSEKFLFFSSIPILGSGQDVK